jgi:UDP-N-acetylmuramyl pentapeptide phosphotransferase/UDP-N-acetylglucosamine-1-phosphate transferase
MHLVPAAVALITALVIVGPTLRALADSRLAQENYKGETLPFPAGVVVVAAALLALAPVAALAELADANVLRPETGAAAVYLLGVAFLGLLDDALGGDPRGWRGHGSALLTGGISTGVLKAAGALGLAAYVLVGRYDNAGEYVLAVSLLVLTTNLFNLLDLRPGRSAKVFVVLAVLLSAGATTLRPLEALGVFAAPVLVVALHDVRERAMLGDTGSNVLGGLAGFWLLLTLSTLGQAIALAIVIGITIYGEFRSISQLVERNPLLRRLDSLGRPG